MRASLAACAVALGLAGTALAQVPQAQVPQAQTSQRPSLAVFRQALVGTWQDLNNTRFTREFDADGTSVRGVDGDPSAAATGHWRLFEGSAVPAGLAGFGRKFDPAGFYVEIDESGDTLLFALLNISRDSLQMVYLERGNTLSFGRLK